MAHPGAALSSSLRLQTNSNPWDQLNKSVCACGSPLSNICFYFSFGSSLCGSLLQPHRKENSRDVFIAFLDNILNKEEMETFACALRFISTSFQMDTSTVSKCAMCKDFIMRGISHQIQDLKMGFLIVSFSIHPLNI